MEQPEYYYCVYSKSYRTRYQVISAMQRFPHYRLFTPAIAVSLPQYCLLFIEWDQVSTTSLFAMRAAGCFSLGFSQHQAAPYFSHSFSASLGPISINHLIMYGVHLHQASLAEQKKYLTLSWGSDHRYLLLDEIAFLKADNNYCQVYLTEDRYLQAFSTLKSFQQKLPLTFLKVHKSYLIHPQKINRINFANREVYFHGQPQAAHFSKHYRKAMEEIAKGYRLMSY